MTIKYINKKDVISFFVVLFITCIIFIPLLMGHYSTDTYRLIDMGYKEYAIQYSLNDGRIFMCIIGLIADALSVNIMCYVIVLTFISIVVSCISIIEVKKIIDKNNKKGKLLLPLFISYIIIMNFMYIEDFYFTECIVMAMSLLLFIKAADWLNNDVNVFKVSLLVVLGVFCYQGTINFFITFTIVLALIKEKELNKSVLKKLLIALIISFVGILINMIQIKICGRLLNINQERTGSLKDIPKNIVFIIVNIDKILIESSQLFPKCVFLIFLILVMFMILFYNKHYKANYLDTKNILIIIFTAIISSVLINIFSLSSYALGRMVFSVGALIGVIYMYLYCNTTILDNENVLKKIVASILILYSIVNLVNIEKMLIQHRIANELDKYETLKINEYIEKYEKESGIKVTKMAQCRDKDVTWTYNELSNISLFTHRALMIWWCNVETVNYYTNRNLERIKMNEEIYEKNFKNKNWDKLEEEQFIFNNDTLYYCIY